MIEEREARQKILDATDRGPVMWVPISMSEGAFASESLTGRIDSPIFDNSAMDGYAVRAAECKTGDTLNVADLVQPAGPDLGLVLLSGEAIRIFTGAPIPEGADAVIMQEDVKFSNSAKATIEIIEGVQEGEFIRRRGSDVCEGQRILSEGQKISPATVGLVASQGLPNIPIYQRPMVNIVTTGDELIEAGEWPGPGEIYNSNGPMLAAAVEKTGGVAARFHAPDDREVLRAVLEQAVHTGDFVLIAGGVSVGERDYVKETLEKLGVETGFWRVNVKPGKPFLFGRFENRTSVFGLPGNPVSAFVTFALFAAPAIRKWLGDDSVSAEHPYLESEAAIAGKEFSNRGDRPHYLRVKIEPATNRVLPAGTQQSHAIFGLSQADALVRLEAGQTIPAGESVTVWRI